MLIVAVDVQKKWSLRYSWWSQWIRTWKRKARPPLSVNLKASLYLKSPGQLPTTWLSPIINDSCYYRLCAPLLPLGHSEMLCRGRVILTELSLCIECHYNGAVLTGRSRRLNRALILFGLALYLPNVSVSSVFIVLYKFNFMLYLYFLLYFLMSWAWWDWPLTWSTNHCPSSAVILLVGSCSELCTIDALTLSSVCAALKQETRVWKRRWFACVNAAIFTSLRSTKLLVCTICFLRRIMNIFGTAMVKLWKTVRGSTSASQVQRWD